MVDPTVVGVQRIAPDRSFPNSSLLLASVQGAESLRRAMLAGARDCLSRPWNHHELRHSIRRVVDMAPYPEPSAPPAPRGGGLSEEEVTGLREALQAMEHARDLLSRHADLAPDGDG